MEVCRKSNKIIEGNTGKKGGKNKKDKYFYLQVRWEWQVALFAKFELEVWRAA